MVRSGFRRAVRAVSALAGVFAASGAAVANTISTDFITISAVNDAGSASVTIDTSEVTYNPGTQQYEWSTSGFTLMDGANPIADVGPSELSIGTAFNVIFLNFDVDAGLSDTIFTIQTATVSFPVMNDPNAGVSGAINVVDQDEAFGGDVLLTGMNPDGANPAKAFLAQYNGTVPVGTTFFAGVESVANAVGELSGTSGPFGQPNGGSGGLQPVGAPVSDISMQFRFRLSALDNATGNAVYAIIPEPAAALLLIAGGLALGRRR